MESFAQKWPKSCFFVCMCDFTDCFFIKSRSQSKFRVGIVALIFLKSYISKFSQAFCFVLDKACFKEPSFNLF